MPPTRPWTPHPPVWEWDGISEATRSRALEHFEERAAIIEHNGGMVRELAESRAYCLLIETMHEKGSFSSGHVQKMDVVRQLQRREIFRRSDAIGRRIMAGTWPARKKNGERTCWLTEADQAGL